MRQLRLPHFYFSGENMTGKQLALVKEALYINEIKRVKEIEILPMSKLHLEKKYIKIRDGLTENSKKEK